MKRFNLFFCALILSANVVAANQMDCGVVTINDVLTGPRHGAMMRVSNNLCGNGGWLCLDPNAEYMTENESDRLFSFVLSSYMADKKIKVWAYTDVYASACGSYPVVEDVRTP